MPLHYAVIRHKFLNVQYLSFFEPCLDDILKDWDSFFVMLPFSSTSTQVSTSKSPDK